MIEPPDQLRIRGVVYSGEPVTNRSRIDGYVKGQISWFSDYRLRAEGWKLCWVDPPEGCWTEVHPTMPEGHRCKGAPAEGWGALTSGKSVSAEECAEACLGRAACQVAAYNNDTRACSFFEECTEYHASAKPFISYQKHCPPTPAPTPAPPTPAPTPAPSPGMGLCCWNGCGGSDCQGGWCGESR